MKRRKWLIYLLVLVMCLGYILYDSKYHLEVTEYSLSSYKLPEAFDGYRIVQLSDLHAMEFGRGNRRLIEAVADLSPDLIALTGDYIETAGDIPITKHLVKALSQIAPVYFCSGNHDWASGAAPDLRCAIEDSGGTYLGEQYALETRGEQFIVIAGVEDPNSYADLIHPDAFMETVSQNYPDAFTILLGHRNDWPEQYPDLPADLIFSGHGHGGILRLPGIGGLLGTDHKFFPEYDAGLFPSNHYIMAVSRGLGSFDRLPRFLNRPEILSLTLHCG